MTLNVIFVKFQLFSKILQTFLMELKAENQLIIYIVTKIEFRPLYLVPPKKKSSVDLLSTLQFVIERYLI